MSVMRQRWEIISFQNELSFLFVFEKIVYQQFENAHLKKKSYENMKWLVIW